MLDWIASVTGAQSVRRGRTLQSLWGGYGEAFRVELENGVAPTAVVKWVRPPPQAKPSASDLRKRYSYDVEATFYREYAARCDDSCRVAKMFGSQTLNGGWLFVLEDLDAAGFAERHEDANTEAVGSCLTWLASFHARFLGEEGPGLWPIGTYWHLATRTDEVKAIADANLRNAAPVFDKHLSAARYQTILHGDPKEANFCFTSDGKKAAAVDFQYTGRGCAMKDVAYLLYGRTDDPTKNLDLYFKALKAALPGRDTGPIEAEWRSLYPIARLDFCRFLAGWRPAMWQRDRGGQDWVRREIARL